MGPCLVHSALFSGCVDPADIEQAVVFWSRLGTLEAVVVVPPNLVVVLGRWSLEKCPCTVGGSEEVGGKIDVEGLIWSFFSKGLDDDDLFPVVWLFDPEGLPELVFLGQWIRLSYFPRTSVEAVVGGWLVLLVVGSGGCGR